MKRGRSCHHEAQSPWGGDSVITALMCRRCSVRVRERSVTPPPHLPGALGAVHFKKETFGLGLALRGTGQAGVQ